VNRATLLRVGCAAFAIHLSSSACATNRCTEFQVDALAVGAKVGVEDIGASAHLERQPSRPLSEEAAIYAKRLKTLCELLWEERISYSAYRSAAREAYDGYQSSRTHYAQPASGSRSAAPHLLEATPTSGSVGN